MAGFVAVLGAAAFSLSPGGMTLVFVLSAIVWWAVRDLEGVERRWVTSILASAVAARVVSVIALSLLRDSSRQSFGSPFGDSTYAIARSIWIRNVFAGVPIAARDFAEAFDPSYGASSYNYLLAWYHALCGPSPYAAHLVSTVFFMATVTLLFRLARACYGRGAAVAGLVVVAFLPSLFVWSIMPLKEAPFTLLIALAVAAVMVGVRLNQWRARVGAVVVVAITLGAISTLRPFAFLLAASALAAGLAAWFLWRTRWTSVVCVAAALLAIGAVPRVRAGVDAQVILAAAHHIGYPLSAGHSYRLLDPEYYQPAAPQLESMSAAARGRFLIRSAVRFFTVPEPWILRPGVELALIPQQVLWYALIVAATIGVWAGLRRDPLLTCLLAGVGVTTAALVGPNSGNIGTLMRHRDTMVPFMVWLSAAGGVRVLATPSLPAARWQWNRIDLVVGVLALGLVPFACGLFVLFHTPAPALQTVSPMDVIAGQRVTLHGQHLRPFLRAFVRSEHDRVELQRPLLLLDRAGANGPTPAGYLGRNEREAEIELPRDLAAGVYDLGLFEGGDRVAVLPRAFTIAAPPPPVAASVQVDGRLLGIPPMAIQSLTATAPMTAADRFGVALTTVSGPALPDRRLVRVGAGSIPVIAEGTVQLRASGLARCQIASERCVIGDRTVAPGATFDLVLAGRLLTFEVDRVMAVVR